MPISWRLARPVAGVSLLLNSGFSLAQQFEPSAIRTESGIDIIPELLSELRYDDNITHSHAAEQSSWIAVLAPAVKFQLAEGASLYSLQGRAERGNYFSSTDDNYTDLDLNGQIKLDLNSRHRLNISGYYKAGHEARGTGITEGRGDQQLKPAEFDAFNINGYYEFGAMTSPGRLRLLAAYYDKEYSNYPELTAFRNYDNLRAGVVFYYTVGAFTRLLTEVTTDDTRYDLTDETGSRDSRTYNYRAGLEWQPSTLTGVELRAGYQTKKFDDPQRQDFGGLAWQLKLNWAPLSYSGFELTTGRRARDPNTQGDYVRETNYSVNWRHQWTSFFTSRLSLSLTDDLYTGFERKDTLKSVSFRGYYSLKPNLLLNGGIALSRHSSTLQTMQYDKNQLFFGLQLAL